MTERAAHHGAPTTSDEANRANDLGPRAGRLVKRCELCELARTTPWYAEADEPFRYVLLDCDSCDVPMAVLGAHRPTITAEERAVLERALGEVADAKYPQGWFFDDHMRQIPDHYHVHARPYPRWWPGRRS
jgi:hypothetical protein